MDNKWNYKNVISSYHRIYYIEGKDQISGVDKVLELTGACGACNKQVFLLADKITLAKRCTMFLSRDLAAL